MINTEVQYESEFLTCLQDICDLTNQEDTDFINQFHDMDRNFRRINKDSMSILFKEN